MSNCYMILEKSDFELLQVALLPHSAATTPSANRMPSCLFCMVILSWNSTRGCREQPRTLFLRSVDAALECMLIYFGMESTYLYDSEVAGKRLL